MKKISLKGIGAVLLRVACCFSLFVPGKLLASHFAAVDLNITYIGAGVDGCTGTAEYKYEVALDIYKACEAGNVDLPTTATVAVKSTNAGFTDNITLTTPVIDTLDELCASFKSQNSCRVPGNTNLPGFVKHAFKAVYTLPSAQADWVFSWSSGARNGGIQNLVNPSTKDIYVEAGLNNVIRYNNSTPRFEVPPLPYLCSNQKAVYLNGPFDINGDSLNVTNIQPMSAANTPIPYKTTATGASFDYSLSNPIGSAVSDPYTVNPLTGAATFLPTGAGYFVLAFKCEEYDRKTGQVIGYITRDAQVSVLNCSFPPPAIDSIPSKVDGATLVGRSVLVCPGSQLSLSFASSSLSATNQLYMAANTDKFPGSGFTVDGAGTNSIKGVFDWTPAPSDIGEYTLTVTSKDSSCSGLGFAIVLKNYTTMLIRVVNGIDAGKDIPICQLNPSPVQLFVKGADFLQTVKWTDIDGGVAKDLDSPDKANPIAAPKQTTSYLVSTPDLKGTCKSSDTVTVFTDTRNAIDIFPQGAQFVMCRPGYLQLDAVITGKPPRSNLVCGVANPVSCNETDSVQVYGSPVYGNGFSYDTLGAATPVLYNDVKSAKYQFLITKDELREYGLYAATIRALSFETAKTTASSTFEYANFSIALKCTDKNRLDKGNGFETGMVPVYKATGPTFFNDGTHRFVFDTPYSWDTTKNLLVELCYSENPAVVAGCTPVSGTPPLIKFMPTSYISGLSVKASNATVNSVCGTTTSGVLDNAARPVFTFSFCDAPGLPFTIKWSPAPMVSDSSIKAPLTYVPRTTKYTVETYGATGCLVRDTLNVRIPMHNFAVVPADTSVCYGQAAQLAVKNGSYYQWFEYEEGKYVAAHNSLSCDYCADPVAKPQKSTHYKVMVGDDVFCYDTIDAYVEVRPLPVVKIMTHDTVVKYGQSIELLATGGKLYNWTPVASLNNPNISYPVATPTEPTTYVVSGISSTGCYAYDTVRVGINYRDNLQIPTAFSPNGDGKNDIFHVTNLTFQRVVEFKVFNRWGQQIYSGSGDAKAGWDGSWKGVPQEMGDYNYVIGVGYPDGLVEKYKGTVTLIR